MICERFGCDCGTSFDPQTGEQACPAHGPVVPLAHGTLIDRRWAQARIEIGRMVQNALNEIHNRLAEPRRYP